MLLLWRLRDAGQTRLALTMAAMCFAAPSAARPQGSPATPVATTAPVYAVSAPVSDSGLARQITDLLASPAASRAHWGIAVTTLEGTPLYGLDEGKLFRPASNAKLFTTAAAMALLGPDTRVTTVVSASAAPDANGIVQGDLVVHGAGDANLSGQHIPYEQTATRRARLAREAAQETAAEEAAGKQAMEKERARQRTAGQAASGYDQRSLAEASNTAAGEVRDRFAPDALLPMEDLAAQIAAAGVKGLTGALRGDSSLWRGPAYPETWEAGDALWGYGASVNALEFNDGQLLLHIAPGTRAGEPATLGLDPDVNSFGLPTNQVKTVASAAAAGVAIEPRNFPGADILRGEVALGHPDTEEIAAREPALFALNALNLRLLAHGIRGGTGTQTQPAPPASVEGFALQLHQPVDLAPKLQAETSPLCGRDFDCGAVVLARRVSPTVAEDVTVTLKESQNLHAEMLLRRLGRAYGTEGSAAQGARVVRQWLLKSGLDPDDTVLYDGSGLSGHDLVTPRATAQLLAFATRQPWFKAWKAALPIGGVDGTLEHRFTEAPLKGRVLAKTGTLGESRALAGYLTCGSGRELIFAIMVDNHGPFGSTDRATMDQIVAAIAAAN